jgi:pimeloyl-ACP methyl ester carboxylesterase
LSRSGVVAIALLLFLLLVAALGGGVMWLWTPDKPLEELEANYLASPDDMRDVAGVRLHARDTGRKDASAVIMIHGFGSSLHTWEAWAWALSADYRVIRFDLPGSGLSGADPTGDYTDRRSLQVLAALMDQLGVWRATLIGNSIGGRIAWNFAVQQPDRVNKLVLVSPDGFASPGVSYGVKPEVPMLAGMMRYALPKSMLRTNLVPAYGDPERLTDDVVTRYHDLMLAPGVRDAMIARMEQTILEDPEPLLRRIAAPTLLVWGEKDGMIPFSNSADYLRTIPDATLAALPGLGHVPQEEAPAVALEAVAGFLKR